MKEWMSDGMEDENCVWNEVKAKERDSQDTTYEYALCAEQWYYEGRPINKIQNGIILLFVKI